MKNFLRKLAITFGILMLFVAIDIAVAWYFNPQAQTPVQAVRMEATHAAAEIAAKLLKAKLKQQEQTALTAPAPTPEQAASSPDQPQTQVEQPAQQEDKGTQLQDIQAEGNILVYTITIKASGQAFDLVMQNLHSSLFPSGCTKPEYVRLLEYGLGVTLDFRSQDGLKQDAISFTPEICGYEPIDQPNQKKN